MNCLVGTRVAWDELDIRDIEISRKNCVTYPASWQINIIFSRSFHYLRTDNEMTHINCPLLSADHETTPQLSEQRCWLTLVCSFPWLVWGDEAQAEGLIKKPGSVVLWGSAWEGKRDTESVGESRFTQWAAPALKNLWEKSKALSIMMRNPVLGGGKGTKNPD